MVSATLDPTQQASAETLAGKLEHNQMKLMGINHVFTVSRPLTVNRASTEHHRPGGRHFDAGEMENYHVSAANTYSSVTLIIDAERGANT